MRNLRIFISSPGDVGREREVSRKVIERVEAWFGGRVKLEGYFWEHEPMRTTRGDFQGQIPEPSSFDLVVCILWSRLGSRLHPGMHQRADGSTYASGTEYEFESAVAAFQKTGSPDLLVYRRAETPLFPPEPREEMEQRLSQWESLKKFCDRWFRDQDEGTFTAAFNTYSDSGDFERGFEEHLRRLVEERLLKDGGEAGTPVRRDRWWQGSPYRGLQAFEFEHEPVFFGRTKAGDEVLGALRARSVEDKCPFVLIFGASGSGRSSLMRAGVIPWLVRPGVIEGVGLWRRAILRPAEHSNDLLDGLTRVLVQAGAVPELTTDGTSVEELTAILRDEPKGITGLIKGALSQAAAEEQRRNDLEKAPVARLALGLDQLEEVFTLQERFGENDRQLFFRALGALARSGYVWVVATLRSDFYNRCEEVPELVELKKNRGQYHLLPPTQTELSQMIRYPAEAAGVTFEEDVIEGKLEEVIAREAQDQPGALPLLKYALDLLYEVGGDDGLLTHAEYELVGRVTGAVAKRAEEAFQSLGETERASLDSVLRGLVTLGDGEGEVAVRKSANYEDLCRPPGAKALVGAFLAARLFTTDRDAGGRSTVTVAHEALLHVWLRVTDWVRENREFLRQRARLGHALAEWTAHQKHEDYLLSPGLPLAEAESLLVDHETTLGGEEKAFILASRDKVQQAENRRRSARTAVMAALAVLACGAMVGGWLSWINAKAAKQGSLRNTEMLKEASMADYSTAVQRMNTEDKWHEGVAYLLRALRWWPENSLAAQRLFQTIEYRIDAQRNMPVLLLEYPGEMTFAGFSSDGLRILTIGADNAARVWDAANGKLIGEPMEHKAAINRATFSSDGSRIVTASEDNEARVWDTETGKLLGEPILHDAAVMDAVFSPDDIWIVTSSDVTAQVWDVASGNFIGKPMRHKDFITRASFSPDGSRVVTSSVDETAGVWDASSGEKIASLEGHQGWVLTASFNPDGTRIVTASRDETARIWDATSGKTVCEPLRHQQTVASASFSPDGSRIVTASFDGTARVWDAVNGTSVGERMVHGDRVTNAAFSPDGLLIVTACFDTLGRVWDASTGKPIGVPLRHDQPVKSAAFGPNGSSIITASGEKLVRVWDVARDHPTGEPLRHENTVTSATFHPDGWRVLTASNDSTARVWDTSRDESIGERLQHEYIVTSASFSRDGSLIITVSGGLLRVWDSARGQPVGEPLQHSYPVRSASFSPDGSRIVTSSGVTAQVWDVASGKVIGMHMLHQETVNSASFSPDGLRIVTGSADHTARVWDSTTNKSFGEPMRHEGAVTSAAFSSDGRRIVTASVDNTARVWEARGASKLPENWSTELAPLAWALAGIHFDSDGEAQIIPASKRRTPLSQVVSGDDDWARLFRWAMDSSPSRPTFPGSNRTVRGIAEQERDSGTKRGLKSSLSWDSTVPLSRLMLAAYVDNSQNSSFLRRYDLDRLPEDAGLWARASESLLDQDQTDQAREAAEKAISIDASSALAHRILAASLYAAGNAEDALKSMETLLQLPDATAQDFSGAGYLAGQTATDGGRARTFFSDGKRKFPTDPEIFRSEGWTLIGLDSPGEALPAFQQILVLNPGDVDALTGLVISHWLNGDLDGAVAGYRQLLEADDMYGESAKIAELDWLGAEMKPLLEALEETLKRHPDLKPMP